MKTLSPAVESAYEKVKAALNRAYAPYSGLHVGCALKLKGQDEPVLGVNVENASYGGTICAERSAIVSMVSQFGKKDIEFVIVISDYKGQAIPPCGLCLQVLNEFVGKDCEIYLGSPEQLSRHHTFSEFLPLAFSAEMLPD